MLSSRATAPPPSSSPSSRELAAGLGLRTRSQVRPAAACLALAPEVEAPRSGPRGRGRRAWGQARLQPRGEVARYGLASKLVSTLTRARCSARLKGSLLDPPCSCLPCARPRGRAPRSVGAAVLGPSSPLNSRRCRVSFGMRFLLSLGSSSGPILGATLTVRVECD